MQNAQQKPASKNYLSRIALDLENRRWPRRECQQVVRILYPKKGLRKLCVSQIRLLDISEGGAMGTTRDKEIPEHFYIVIGKLQYHIGCSLIGRNDAMVRLRFIKEQPSIFIDIFAETADPLHFLNEIRLPLYGLEA